MELIKSNRGGLKLYCEGHMYTRKKVNKNSIRWECVKRTSHSCKGSATTDIEMKTFDLGVSHCHGGNVAEVKATKVRCTMKEKAMSTMDKSCQIFAAAVGTGCHNQGPQREL